MEDLDLEKVEARVFEVLSEVHEEVLKRINGFDSFEDFYNYAVENSSNPARYDLMGDAINDPSREISRGTPNGRRFDRKA